MSTTTKTRSKKELTVSEDTLTLAKITGKAISIASQIAREAMENSGEISEISELELQKTDFELAHKVEGYAAIIEQLEMNEKVMQERAVYFAETSKRIRSKIDFLESRIESSIKAMEVDCLKGIDCEYRMVNNPPKVEILDLEKIPTEFKKEIVKTEVKVDKKAILESFKMGFEIEGCKVEVDSRLKKCLRRD